MINLDDCVELGIITKTSGFRGHLVLKLNNLSFDDIEEMEQVFVLIDGLPVPFFFEEFSERAKDSLLIKFDDLNSEESVKFLCDNTVYLHKKYIDIRDSKNLNNLSVLTGYTVIDKNKGTIGLLDSVTTDNDNPLMIIQKDFREILIPLQQEFIIGIDDQKKEILVNCPDGLIDLFS